MPGRIIGSFIAKFDVLVDVYDGKMENEKKFVIEDSKDAVIILFVFKGNV